MLRRADAGGTFCVKGFTGRAGNTFSVEWIPAWVWRTYHACVVEGEERQGWGTDASLFVEIEDEVVGACDTFLQFAVPELRRWAGWAMSLIVSMRKRSRTLAGMCGRIVSGWAHTLAACFCLVIPVRGSITCHAFPFNIHKGSIRRTDAWESGRMKDIGIGATYKVRLVWARFTRLALCLSKREKDQQDSSPHKDRGRFGHDKRADDCEIKYIQFDSNKIILIEGCFDDNKRK